VPLFTRIVVGALALLAWAAPATAGPESALDILKRAESAHAWVYHSATTNEVEEITQQSDKNGAHIKGTVIRYEDAQERVHFDTRFRELKNTFSSKGPSSKVIEAHYILADGRHAYYGAPGVIVNLARDPQRFEKWRRVLHAMPRLGGFLDGWVQTTASVGGSAIFELARGGQCEVAQQTEPIGGIECVRLDAATPAGKLQAWFAPSRDYGLARLTLYYKGEGTGDFSEYRIVVDQIEFEQVDGRWVAIAGRYQAHRVPADANAAAYDESVTVRRTRVDLKPKFDPATFSFAMIPNGTMAQVEDDIASGVQYVWRDGDAVPTIDERTAEQMRRRAAVAAAERNGSKGQPAQPPFSRRLLPEAVRRAGLALLAAVAALLAYLGIERWVLPRWRVRGDRTRG
jgi:hypothetical protein